MDVSALPGKDRDTRRALADDLEAALARADALGESLAAAYLSQALETLRGAR